MASKNGGGSLVVHLVGTIPPSIAVFFHPRVLIRVSKSDTSLVVFVSSRAELSPD